MQRVMEEIFARWGAPARLTAGDKAWEGKVFFQSISSTAWQNMERLFMPLGEVPRGKYRCILPVASGAKAGDTLTVGQKQYLICRAEEMAIAAGPAYIWGLCVEKGEEDTWGRNG